MRIPVIQDGEIFYARIDDQIYWHAVAIRAHPLTRVAHRRARDAFTTFMTGEFPDAEIEWVRNVDGVDR